MQRFLMALCEMNHDEKCGYISTLAKQVTVLSEVGIEGCGKNNPPYKWIEQMQTELDAECLESNR